ncbi:hypothetical protein JKP88DRAFT_282534 [Tribonema minus]|uniref:Uncharacterized protein n=1 Tax=Tribonema minus TaxID=303371 RepID=A0A835YTH3_9STRA|nr:hypothetical protein JKP88DRAFT_282534 [Tribonema minus]
MASFGCGALVGSANRERNGNAAKGAAARDPSGSPNADSQRTAAAAGGALRESCGGGGGGGSGGGSGSGGGGSGGSGSGGGGGGGGGEGGGRGGALAAAAAAAAAATTTRRRRRQCGAGALLRPAPNRARQSVGHKDAQAHPQQRRHLSGALSAAPAAAAARAASAVAAAPAPTGAVHRGTRGKSMGGGAVLAAAARAAEHARLADCVGTVMGEPLSETYATARRLCALLDRFGAPPPPLLAPPGAAAPPTLPQFLRGAAALGGAPADLCSEADVAVAGPAADAAVARALSALATHVGPALPRCAGPLFRAPHAGAYGTVAAAARGRRRGGIDGGSVRCGDGRRCV